MTKSTVVLLTLLLTSGNLWAMDEAPKILGQNADGSLKGILMEQRIGCGPRSCLTNFWQDLNGDGLVDIVSLYVVWKNGHLQFIMQDFLIRKSRRI